MTLAKVESRVTWLICVMVHRQLVEEVDLYARGHQCMTARSVDVPPVRSPTPDAFDLSVVDNNNNRK